VHSAKVQHPSGTSWPKVRKHNRRRARSREKDENSEAAAHGQFKSAHIFQGHGKIPPFRKNTTPEGRSNNQANRSIHQFFLDIRTWTAILNQPELKNKGELVSEKSISTMINKNWWWFRR
jgi:hypothetical protein